MMQIRQVNSCVHHFTRDLKCTRCGQYNYKNQSLKTTKYATPFHFNLRHYLNSLRKSATKIVEPKQISEDTSLLLSSICDKFMFTNETLALGTYIYQTLNKLNTNQKFWSSSALIVAGKAIELDKNVPYLNRYQRYAEKSFSQQEYEQAERTIFESMNFEIQYSTFITFLDFYMTCGVLFKDDGINTTLIQFFEDDVQARAKEFLKRGTFTKYEPQLLALGIIKQIRHKYNLQSWNCHLQQLAGYCEDEIMAVSSYESTLREIQHNGHYKFSEIKGLSVRKKYQNILKSDKGVSENFGSVHKSNILKSTSYSSSSKQLLPANNRKPSHHFVAHDAFTSINSELLNKRR